MLQVDLTTIKRAHRNFLHNHDRSFDYLLSEQRQTHTVQEHIEANAAFKRRTGNLKKRSVARVFMTKNRTLVRIQNDAKYAFAQDKGSGEHGPKHAKYPITPKGEGYPLRFFWKKKGQWWATYKVMHPGVRATHFLETATAVSFRTTGVLLREAMSKAAKLF